MNPAEQPDGHTGPFAQRQELLEALLMDHSDAICALDLDDRILFVNQAAADLLGGTVDSLTGRFQQEVFGDRVYAETQKQLDERLQGRGSTYELGMYDAQGRERTLLVTGNPLRDRGGRIVGSFGVLKDITERKAREQALETRLLLDQAVSDSVRLLVQAPHPEEALPHSLGALGILLNAERVRLYEVCEQGAELACTQQWPPAKAGELPGGFPLHRYGWWLEELRRGEVRYFHEGNPLPGEAERERRTMEELGIHSLVVLPLLLGETLLGFVTFENPEPFGHLVDGDLDILRVYGDVLAATLAHRVLPCP